MRPSSLSLVIKNNTASTLALNLLGGMASQQSNNANARTRYQYDVSGESYDADEVSIQVKSSGPAPYELFVAPLLQKNLAGVVAALNSLGFGTWYSEVSGDTTLIVIYHDTLIFGDLSISVEQTGDFTLEYAATDYGSIVLQLDAPGSARVIWEDGVEQEVLSDGGNTIIANHAYEDGLFPRTIRIIVAEAQRVTDMYLNQNDTLISFTSTAAFANCNSIMIASAGNLDPAAIGAFPANLHSLVITDGALDTLPTLPTNLYSLDCQNMSVDNSVFSQLNSGLKEALLGNNSLITEVDNLPAGLLVLDVSNCMVNAVTSLSPALQILGLSGCRVEGVLALPAAPSLISLTLTSSQLLTGVTNLPAALQELYINSVPFLAACPLLPNSLRTLEIGSNASLASVPATWPDALISLGISSTPSLLGSLGDFSNTQLLSLQATACRANAIGPLPATVQTIVMSSCPNLTDFTPISHTVLTTLRLEACNVLANFDYALPPTMVRLDLWDCPNLETSPVSFNEGLLQFYCYNNKITSFAAFPSTLRTAYIYNTLISAVPDISACTDLQDFELGFGDNINTVDPTIFAGVLASLGTLNWLNGKLTSLAVSNLLIYLNANSPRSFAYVDLRMNPAAVPNAGGLAAKAALQGRGWTVQTDV
jgi:hypothetical protein